MDPTRPAWRVYAGAMRHAHRHRINLVAHLLAKTAGRLQITGAPPAGQAIYISNHIGSFDAAVLSAAFYAFDRTPSLLAKDRFFDGRFGAVLQRAGHIAVPPEDPHGRHAAYTAALEKLKQGEDLAFYPEGRIGLDPLLWPEFPQTGIGRLQIATGLPVVPIAQWGAHEVLPTANSKAVKPRSIVRYAAAALRNQTHRPKLRIHFGDPVDLTAITDPLVASERCMLAIANELLKLRREEPVAPRYDDPRRRTSTTRRFIVPVVEGKETTLVPLLRSPNRRCN